MRGHVVGTLGRVHEQRIAVGHEPGRECFEVAPHVAVGVLADDHGRARVVHEHGAQPAADLGAPYHGLHLCGDVLRPAPGGPHPQHFGVVAHDSIYFWYFAFHCPYGMP